MKRFLLPTLAAWLALSPAMAPMAAEHALRLTTIDDLAALSRISELQALPNSDSLLYTVSRPAIERDGIDRELWQIAGKKRKNQLLLGPERSFAQARWLPDGTGFSFLSEDQGRQQVWRSRQGEPSQPITHVSGQISDYQWSKDGRQLLLVYRETQPRKDNEPWVIEDLNFKRDGVGYLTSATAALYLYDLADGNLQRLVPELNTEPRSARWSPDGRYIAFIASQDSGLQARESETLFVVDTRKDAPARALAPARAGFDSSLAWTPDGKALAFLTSDERSLDFRQHAYLAWIKVDGSGLKPLTRSLNLGVAAPSFSTDGNSLRFIVTGDRRQGLSELDLRTLRIKPLLDQALTLTEYASTGEGIVYAASADTRPAELYLKTTDAASEPGQPLTALHAELNKQVRWAASQDIAFTSSDGQSVHALLTLPGNGSGKRLPTLLSIHGGPNAQDSHAFVFDRQLLAAQGYAVLNVNYRGSAGRGSAFSQAISGDWGNLPVADLLAGVEHLVDSGIADPSRLVVGGWSFGGLLTDYLISKDPRFKAAVSGAGSGNRISQYGHDQWLHYWHAEYPKPWQEPQRWIDASYPFFHADRIRTPTLFLAAERDWSVPAIGSEQMYQALRVNGVPSVLVVYPNEAHELRRPSSVRDRLQRSLQWYEKWLKVQP
ncbi:S9 family peptidase [Pseudomonas sp. LRF_L74]|uniref:S9 family peptidase n=1 Tax=Pseudomonas sp. LRF_L74 TaxID=3369422 RepID=UPI003F5D74F8